MTKTTYTAFGALRTSDNAYPFASCDGNGTVRFHSTRTAAERFRRVAATVIVTAAEARAIKAAADAKADRIREDDAKIMAVLRAGGDWRAVRDELAVIRHREVMAAEKAAS